MALLRVETADGIGRLTLDDPDRRNVLSAGLVGELTAAFDRLEADGTRAVVITGSGTAFCAGADLGDLVSASDGDTSGVRRVYDGFLRVRSSPLPTIAAVNGPAVGAGLNLALACDVRVAARSAMFDARFARIGLHPGGGNLWMLREAAGPQTAAALALFGQRLDGEAAVRAGLAFACVPDDELAAAVDALARRAAAVNGELLRTIKRTLTESRDLSHEDALALETDRQLWSMALPSTRERLRAFKERITG